MSVEEIAESLINEAANIQHDIRKHLAKHCSGNSKPASHSETVSALSSPVQTLEVYSSQFPSHYNSDVEIFSQDSFAPSLLMKTLLRGQNGSQVSLRELETDHSGRHTSSFQQPVSHEGHELQHANNKYASLLALLDVELTLDDIIVEKMHIHYGLKDANPVNRLRFYPKNAYSSTNEEVIAKQVKEMHYETVLPRVFEELAVRLFCRDNRKTKLLMKAFERWCRESHASSPILGLSQLD